MSLEEKHWDSGNNFIIVGYYYNVYLFFSFTATEQQNLLASQTKINEKNKQPTRKPHCKKCGKRMKGHLEKNCIQK